jgi:hypothetical protein
MQRILVDLAMVSTLAQDLHDVGDGTHLLFLIPHQAGGIDRFTAIRHWALRRFGPAPAQQNGWIRLRQNLLRQFDYLPGALYQLAIILAGAKNLDSGYQGGVSRIWVSSRHRLRTQNTYSGFQYRALRFQYHAAKGNSKAHPLVNRLPDQCLHSAEADVRPQGGRQSLTQADVRWQLKCCPYSPPSS